MRVSDSRRSWRTFSLRRSAILALACASVVLLFISTAPTSMATGPRVAAAPSASPSPSPPSTPIDPVVAKKIAEGKTATPTPIPSNGTHFASEGIDVVPVDSSVSASTTPEQAVEALIAQFPVHQGDSKPDSVELMIASNGNWGTPDSVPTYLNRLAWVVTYANTAPRIHPPDSMSPEEVQRILNSAQCKSVGIVDAESLAGLSFFQMCSYATG